MALAGAQQKLLGSLRFIVVVHVLLFPFPSSTVNVIVEEPNALQSRVVLLSIRLTAPQASDEFILTSSVEIVAIPLASISMSNVGWQLAVGAVVSFTCRLN